MAITENAYHWTSLSLQAATLLLAGAIAWLVQRETAKEDVAAAYVEIAAAILMAPATEETVQTGMRCWALKLLIKYSPNDVPIPDELRKAMLEGRVIASWQPPGHQPEGSQPKGSQPSIVADPECEL